MPKKTLASLLIVGWSFLILVDGIPSTSVLHDNLKPIVRPMLNLLGQWQGNLKLFAPTPDRLNAHLEAKFTLADGTQAHWRSPDWRNQSSLRTFVDYRMMRYVDAARLDSYSPAWPHLARYLATEYAKSTGMRVKKISLSRHWGLIEDPKSSFHNPLVVPPHSLSYLFYEKDFSG